MRTLEGLVTELTGQLEQARAAARAAGASPSAAASPGGSSYDADLDRQRGASPTASVASGQGQVGKMVNRDAARGRYISHNFWSKVMDEVR